MRTSLIMMVYLASLFCRAQSPYFSPISLEDDSNFQGFDLLDTRGKSLFVLGENWHNIRSVPKATFKLLKYLHEKAGVRILALELGASSAYMMNQYLNSGDTTKLRQIARNTMYWSQEHWAFLEEVRLYNASLPPEEHVFFESIDIEYKMESAIFVINELIEQKEVPVSLNQTVGAFKQLFEQSREHREKYQGLAVMFYYEKEVVTDLVKYTLADLKLKESDYRDFFGKDYDQFVRLIEQMHAGLLFDYTNPTTNYKFRDRIIYWNFVELSKKHPYTGILCAIGMRHTNKRSSIHTLANAEESPYFNKVVKIRVTALLNNSFPSNDLRKINYSNPNTLRKHSATLIRHVPDDKTFRSKKGFDYTLLINEQKFLTPFPNVFKENY